MDKLKNLLKSDTPVDEPETSGQTGLTGKLSGPGSHFPGKDDSSSYPTSGQPGTVTGTETTSRGPADVSASQPDPSQALYTAGPERGGTEHVGTTTTSSAEHGTTSAATSGGPQTTRYTVTNADFPKTESSADGSGTAAIGQTSTYSSSHLSRGDPVSSVIDTDSRDPLTYKKPESGLSDAGVGEGAAAAAASTAFSSSQERSKTELAGHENPYKTSNLDPRVDGGSRSNAPSALTAGAGAGAGAGLAGAGAAQTSSHPSGTSTTTTAPASSTLTTTADPADRSAEYGQSTASKGLDNTDSVQTTSSDTTGDVDRQPSLANRVLGAVGLGSLAGAAGAKATSSREDTAVDNSQPMTTTGITSYTSPTQSGPGTGHHRKESIPTTAYPAGEGSPSAINAPVGGTQPRHDESTSRTAAGGADLGAAGAGLGAAAVSDSHYRESAAVREHATGQPTEIAPAATATAPGHAVTGVSSSHYDESKALRDNATSSTATGTGAATGTTTGTTIGTTPVHHATTSEPTTSTSRDVTGQEDHSGRNAALGAGAGAAAIGAGAYGAHEYSKREAETAESEAVKQQAAYEKDLRAQREAAEKEAARQQKEAEKQAAKEEKHHQKEVEKEHKKHEKEAAALEKKHEKELEKQEHERQKALEREEEDRRRAAGGVLVADDSEKQKEKKPSIFKRIFKRRKNEKTGEDEEYSTDEDEHKGSAIAGGTAVAGGAAAAGAYAAHEHHHTPSSAAHTDPTAATTTGAGTTSTGITGGTAVSNAQPFAGSATSTDPTTTGTDALASTPAPGPAGAKGFVSTGPDGKSSYTVVPQAATSTNQTSLTASDIAGETHPQPREAITGLPYDPAKDPGTAGVLSQHKSTAEGDLPGKSTARADLPGTTDTAGTTGIAGATGTTTTTGLGATTSADQGHTSLEERLEALKTENFGVLGDHTRRD